jgi:hypothetical protein
MKFEVFEKIIKELELCSNKEQKLYDLGFEIYNIVDEYYKIISLLFKSYYSEKGADWIDWFLYERKNINGSINKVFDNDGNEICKNLKELWLIIEDIRKSKKFIEYQIKPEMTDKERESILKNLFKKF